MSTLKYNTWLNTDNTENYKCRAWVNFNGTGTIAIRASGNVSSITDNGGGTYQVNFTNAMPDANYCPAIFCSNNGSVRSWAQQDGLNTAIYGRYLTTSLSFFVGDTSSIYDVQFVNVAIFR